MENRRKVMILAGLSTLVLVSLILGFLIGIASNGWLVKHDPWNHYRVMYSVETDNQLVDACNVTEPHSIIYTRHAKFSTWLPAVEVEYTILSPSGIFVATQTLNWQNESEISCVFTPYSQ